MLGRLLATLFLVAAACGGSSRAAPEPEPARVPPIKKHPKVTRHPIEVEVAAARTGQSLRLEITGIGRGHEEGEEFENPDRWNITASVDGAPLKHILNGPARVDRHPVGHAYGSQWNVFVRFSVAFAIDPAAKHVDVHVEAPGAPPHKGRLEVASSTALLVR